MRLARTDGLTPLSAPSAPPIRSSFHHALLASLHGTSTRPCRTINGLTIRCAYNPVVCISSAQRVRDPDSRTHSRLRSRRECRRLHPTRTSKSVGALPGRLCPKTKPLLCVQQSQQIPHEGSAPESASPFSASTAATTICSNVCLRSRLCTHAETARALTAACGMESAVSASNVAGRTRSKTHSIPLGLHIKKARALRPGCPPRWTSAGSHPRTPTFHQHSQSTTSQKSSAIVSNRQGGAHSGSAHRLRCSSSEIWHSAFLAAPFGAAALNFCLLDLDDDRAVKMPKVRMWPRGDNGTWADDRSCTASWLVWPTVPAPAPSSALPLISITLRFWARVNDVANIPWSPVCPVAVMSARARAHAEEPHLHSLALPPPAVVPNAIRYRWRDGSALDHSRHSQRRSLLPSPPTQGINKGAELRGYSLLARKALSRRFRFTRRNGA